MAPLNHTAFLQTLPSTNMAGGGVVEYDSNVSLYGAGDTQRRRRLHIGVHVRPSALQIISGSDFRRTH